MSIAVIGTIGTARADDLPDYTDENGQPFDKDSFPLVKAVRMSMSYPFLFTPVILHRRGRSVFVVDGGLLSNFPIWLFDSPNPKRPTWGFRLHGGESVHEGLPYRKIPRPLWAVPLLKAMFSAATEAWDREQMEQVVSARTEDPRPPRAQRAKAGPAFRVRTRSTRLLRRDPGPGGRFR